MEANTELPSTPGSEKKKKNYLFQHSMETWKDTVASQYLHVQSYQ